MIRLGLIASFAATLVSLGAWWWLAHTLPAHTGLLPIHWGVDGRPDGFATRDQALMTFALLPASNVIIAALLCAIPYIEPLRENLDRGRVAYATTWLSVQFILSLVAIGVAFATAHAAGVAVANGNLILRGLIAAGALLVALVGNRLPKTRPNFFFGVRTPWTLSSDLSWERTHRLTGRLFVLWGLWGVLGAFILDGAALTYGLLAPILAIALVAVIYSFFVWRTDPDRRRAPQQA